MLYFMIQKFTKRRVCSYQGVNVQSDTFTSVNLIRSSTYKMTDNVSHKISSGFEGTSKHVA
jgi:hypothetical protein